MKNVKQQTNDAVPTKLADEGVYKFLKKENLLDLIRSIGEELKAKASPNYWRYEDRSRADPHEKLLNICRRGYSEIAFRNICPFAVLRWLESQKVNTAFMEESLRGELEISEAQLRMGDTSGKKYRSNWRTFQGDLYFIEYGDHLNLPCVTRWANKNLPKEAKKLEGSKLIASWLPNPCTRVKMPVQFR